jgi:hypothetical protein
MEILKKNIESLNKKEHVEILKILLKHSCKINENKSGIFVNMSYLNEEVINEINKYMQYIKDQETSLLTVEYQKQLFKNNIVNQVKDNITMDISN